MLNWSFLIELSVGDKATSYEPLPQNKLRARMTIDVCARKGGRVHAGLGFAAMLHSDDYIPLFVSFIDIPLRFGSLF